VDGRLGVPVGWIPYVVGQTTWASRAETVGTAAGADVVDAVVVERGSVVVVTPDRTLVVVVLELLAPPHAARTRDRPPTPIAMKMLRRTGDPLALVRSEDCAPDQHRGQGHPVAPAIDRADRRAR
jgi:hypothetical protein